MTVHRVNPREMPQATPAPAQVATALPAHKPVATPVVKQTVLPAPLRRPQPAPDRDAEPQKTLTAASDARPSATRPAAAPDTPLPQTPEARESYLAHLLEHIDAHKFYPRSARRRGQEGRIEVAFQLTGDGSIRDLRLSGGSRVLRKAAEQAIQRALPLPLPPEAIGLHQVRFDMEYRIGYDSTG